MSQRSTPTLSLVQLGTLIEQLAPLNNRWREGNQAEKVLTLWAIGDVLLNAIENPGDELLWEIHHCSYITRDVLRRALILRRGWEKQKTLAELVQGLRNFTVFREALPFLKGDRKGIDAKTYEHVIALMKERDTRSAIAELKRLKKKHIGRQHHKGAGKLETQDVAKTFLSEIQQLESRLHTNGAAACVRGESAITLSQMAMAIAIGEVTHSPALPVMTESAQFTTLANILVTVMRSGRANVSAFRQQVGAARLMRAADLFNSLQTDQSFAEWQRRNIGQSHSLAGLSLHI